MIAHNLVAMLLNEASVRLPPRSSRWVGIFTGPEPGQQIARSTGLTDKTQALAVTRRWEADSIRKRQARWKAGQPPATPTERLPGLTQAEVAAVMGLSVRAVRAIEQRAFRKLRSHPLLRQYWSELESASESVSTHEPDCLSSEDLKALFGLVQTPIERQALLKVLVEIWTSGD
jgi:hypothetical protein